MSLVRRACDRCHAQKVRCHRDQAVDRTACTRCLNIGERCVHSAPLPTGRPTGRQSSTRESKMSRRSSATATVQSGATSSAMQTDSLPPPIEASQLPWDAEISTGGNYQQMDTSTTATPSWADILLSSSMGEPLDPTLVAHLGISSFDGSTATPPPELHALSLEANFAATFAPDRTDTTEEILKQLSDINMRLYPLVKASSCFAAVQKASPGALLGTMLFDTVTSFLRGNSSPLEPGCHVLFELFSSSQRLLHVLDQILQALQGVGAFEPEAVQDRPPGWTSRTSPVVAMPSPRLDVSSQHVVTPPESSSSSSPSQLPTDSGNSETISQSDSVLHHLLVACYLRLLQIYQVFVSALLLDVIYVRNADAGVTLSLARLRQGVLVQLVTDFLDSLQRNMSKYFSLDSPNSTRKSDSPTCGILQGTQARDCNVITRHLKSIRDDLQKMSAQ